MNDTAELRVEAATVAHLDALAPLFDAYRVFYRQASDVAAAREFLEARLSRGESVAFIAFDALGACGFTQLYPSFSSVSLKRVWILNDLFVAPRARRRGVAEALIRRAATLARDTGAKSVVLETAPDNVSAQRVYDRLGFRSDEGLHYTLSTLEGS